MTNKQKIIMYSHMEEELEEEFWPIMGTLLLVWVAWTGIIHLVDWLTFDTIPWWLEPFTVVPAIFLIVMKERFDSFNPLHWWPLLWGYHARLPNEDRITIRPTDTERIMRQHGGPMNVHIIDYEHIKFRRKRDAVIFGLRYF